MTHQAVVKFGLPAFICLVNSCTSLPTDYPRTSSAALKQHVSTGFTRIKAAIISLLPIEGQL
ncbi:hypothetical protein [Haloferula sp.]|uniref:hypothetical protein n=1 Tax=Haloferula sp. TaxID=2497595 RepID=UPI003C7454FE